MLLSFQDQRMYSLDSSLWYFSWELAIFSDRVIEVLVTCWYWIACSLKDISMNLYYQLLLEKDACDKKLIMYFLIPKMQEERSLTQIIMVKWIKPVCLVVCLDCPPPPPQRQHLRGQDRTWENKGLYSLEFWLVKRQGGQSWA